MIKLDFGTLAQEAKGELVQEHFGGTVFEGVSIDTRSLKRNQLFIALKGEKDDGHKYINDAIDKNAGGLMIQRGFPDLSILSNRIPVVVVENTHLSMMYLAENYRRRLSAQFIAITGSNGKTTTKELVYAIIASRKVMAYRSPGNLNNLYGLPLALFEMPSGAQFGVFELGISVPGEMTHLAAMVKPDLVLITNIGPTHLETLGTIENVAEAKFELVDSLDSKKPVILNSDVPVLMNAAAKRNRKFITFGMENAADFTARRLGISREGYPLVEIDGCEVGVKLFGEHQAYNILAGYAVARTLGLDIRAEDLNNIAYRFAPYRGEIENIDGLTIIADCYNANPVSMRSGLQSYHNYLGDAALKGRRGIAVIGDMLELGENSGQYHREIGGFLAEFGFSMVLAVGPLAAEIYGAALEAGFEKECIRHFADSGAAGEYLVKNIKKGDIIYFKASRGIGLERIITLLKGSAFRQN